MATAKGILSKGITLGYSTTTGAGPYTYTNLDNLQEIPDLGGDNQTVETTTLANSNRTYIPGLKDFGDLTFTFLYSKAGFKELKDLEGETVHWEVGIPDEADGSASEVAFQFDGQPTVAINGVGAGDAITFNLVITISTDMATTYAS